MKIGIYDKWLHSIGGGEKVATTMAETLSRSKKNRVDLIGSVTVNKRDFGKKMGVNLSQVRLIVWGERDYQTLSKKTSIYDLFVNVSYLDHLPSQAKKSLYYVHFPTPIQRNILGFIKYEAVLPFLRKFLIIPSVIKGLDNLDEIIVRAGKWLARETKISFTNLPQKTNIVFRIFAEQFKTPLINAIHFSSPNGKALMLDKFVDQHNNILNFTIQLEPNDSREAIVKIKLDKSAQESGPALVSLTVRDFRYFLFNVIKRFLPRYEMALYGSSVYKPAPGLETYDLFMVNSEFTKKWTKKYWDKDCLVLNPPVDVEEFKPGKKKNFILNVGRFFVGGHSKKQDVLIKVFKEMIKNKMLPGKWELHLVGGVAKGDEHQKYVRKLKDEARGFPIYFHFAASFSQLKRLYSQAKIYWHATGFGENKKKNPICFEHFGISTVEAMAAGAVPIVFNGGGQPEIVKHKQNGFLWNDLNELMEFTTDLVHNRELLQKLSRNSVNKASIFSKKRFSEEFLNIIRSI